MELFHPTEIAGDFGAHSVEPRPAGDVPPPLVQHLRSDGAVDWSGG